MRLRAALVLALTIVLVGGAGLVAGAQTSGSTIDISDVTITRYPRVQAWLGRVEAEPYF